MTQTPTKVRPVGASQNVRGNTSGYYSEIKEEIPILLSYSKISVCV